MIMRLIVIFINNVMNDNMPFYNISIKINHEVILNKFFLKYTFIYYIIKRKLEMPE